MQRWGQYLAEVPQTLLHLIASHQRVSMPRQCSPDERLARLRAAMCRAAAAREAFFGLHADERALVQALLAAPPGAARARMITDMGAIRPLAALRADRTPQSLAERLLLMGWLLPRPASLHHPATYLLAPELRDWLPRPLALPTMVPPSAACDLPLALRAATAIMLAAARAPLPLRRDGRPTAVALRRLRPLLAPATADEADAVICWLVPLLADLDLLVPHGSAAVSGRAVRRFLAQSHPARLDALRTAWVGATWPDAWLRPLRVCMRGMTWPAFRRRLLAWAAALPSDQLVAVATSYESLCRTLGPLADSYTHRLRPAGRSPWQPRRAAAVWQAAVAGPLVWLGTLAHADDATGARCIQQWRAVDIPADVANPWRYGDPGTLYVPHTADDADLLDLQPFAFPIAANGKTTTYRLSRASVAAGSRGRSASHLHGLLERRAGPIPDDWADLLTLTDGLHMRSRTVLLGDHPEVIAALARQPGVRRQIESRVAPGVALVRPGREAALGRALERAGVAVERCGSVGGVGGVGGVEPDSPTPPQPDSPTPPQPDTSTAPPLHVRAALDLIRRAILRRRALHLHYQPADGPASDRWVQPLELERHGEDWLLHAYCMQRQAERCFRVDRIVHVEMGTPPAHPDGERPAADSAPHRPPPAPRTGFFAAPPAPPPDSPLVRVWLEE